MKVNIDKYVLAVVVISVVVAFLTHFPELISLFDHSGENNLFPGIFYFYFAADSLCPEYVLLPVQPSGGAHHVGKDGAVFRPDLVDEQSVGKGFRLPSPPFRYSGD